MCDAGEANRQHAAMNQIIKLRIDFNVMGHGNMDLYIHIHLLFK